MQFFGFLPRFFLGMVLGYLFYYSGNLWMPIIAHFTNNALAILLMYLPFAKKIDTDISQLEKTEISIIQATFFLIIVLFFIYLYKQINRKETS